MLLNRVVMLNYAHIYLATIMLKSAKAYKCALHNLCIYVFPHYSLHDHILVLQNSANIL